MNQPIETLRVAADAAKEGRRRDAGALLDEVAPDFEYLYCRAFTRHAVQEVYRSGRAPSMRRREEPTGFRYAPGRRTILHGAP